MPVCYISMRLVSECGLTWNVAVSAFKLCFLRMKPSDSLYEFQVLPFGLCSASAIFQWIMDSVLTDLKWQSCLIYLDSVVVFSASFPNHLIRLQQIVLEVIQSTNLTLKSQKWHFGYEALKSLGHVVGTECFCPYPQKTVAVVIFPASTDKKSVQHFLGLCTFYRALKLIFKDCWTTYSSHKRRYAIHLELWTRSSFQQALPGARPWPPWPGGQDWSATNIDLGAVLAQRQESIERAVTSRTLSCLESNYATTKCLTVMWALAKFRAFLSAADSRLWQMTTGCTSWWI